MRDLGTTWKSRQFTFPEAKGSEQTHWKSSWAQTLEELAT